MSMTNATNATGKRKRAICRAWVSAGSGQLIMNDCALDSYLPRATHRSTVTYPIEITNLQGQLDVKATVEGGGNSGQAGALRHALSRALATIDPALRPILKKEGLLSRDSRTKERKKYGQKGARKRFQFSKR